MGRRDKDNDGKYLRLTGLWASKSNSALFTGRAAAEQIEELLKRCEEALDADAPLVFSLWENDKKKSKRDPEFSLQAFVGDSEEKPKSSRSSRSSRDDKEEDREDSRDRKRRPARDEEPADDEPEDAPEDEAEEEPEEKPRRRTASKPEPAPAKSAKKRASW